MTNFPLLAQATPADPIAAVLTGLAGGGILGSLLGALVYWLLRVKLPADQADEKEVRDRLLEQLKASEAARQADQERHLREVQGLIERHDKAMAEKRDEFLRALAEERVSRAAEHADCRAERAGLADRLSKLTESMLAEFSRHRETESGLRDAVAALAEKITRKPKDGDSSITRTTPQT